MTISSRLRAAGQPSYPPDSGMWLAIHASYESHRWYLRALEIRRRDVIFISSVRCPLERARSAYVQFGGKADWERWCVEVFCRWPDDRQMLIGDDGSRPDHILRCDRTFTHQLHRLWETLGLEPMMMQRKNTAKQKGLVKPEHTAVTEAAVRERWQWTFDNFDFDDC